MLIQTIVCDFLGKGGKALEKTSVINPGKQLSSSKRANSTGNMSKLTTSAQEQQILPWHILKADTTIADLHTQRHQDYLVLLLKPTCRNTEQMSYRNRKLARS